MRTCLCGKGNNMNEKQIWDRLYSHIKNPYGVAGVMGNFQAESAMKANNLQDSYQASLGFSDETYTAAVDKGTYGNFVYDSAGYGLYQATFWSIKQHLLNYAKSRGRSIGDWDVQVDQLVTLLKAEYSGVWNTLINAESVRQASDAMLLRFERPADQSEVIQILRSKYGEKFFSEFARTEPQSAAPEIAEEPVLTPAAPGITVDVSLPLLKNGSVSNAVRNAQALLIGHGYACGGRIVNGHEQADGMFGQATEKAVREFQKLKGLDPDGVIGKDTWTALITT